MLGQICREERGKDGGQSDAARERPDAVQARCNERKFLGCATVRHLLVFLRPRCSAAGLFNRVAQDPEVSQE